ncbi:NUDIX hydrolase [Oceanicella actignis]|uniref:Nudix hydrolase domain-containing protein n=1 Tax=Oceanicella actignis TaxID=1189325 RepID=A0A1M7S8G5_9RHOB|nr:hypothetical protein [Oceanicella actignis]TYO91657.1 hypothetical protein LY05_00514 [Oceanicella actignis]SET32647.1 hypothetical protein SAMN04488119_103476 [Oceanicella actignis]SHN54708.1 hypothetical protein SAMN05216200_10232 [Oceanicella actignis]
MSDQAPRPDEARASTSNDTPGRGREDRPRKPAPVPRDAATLILARRDADAPRVLMGQRGAGASFMPSKFVFPGGALDPEDAHAAAELLPALRPACAARLSKAAPEGLALPLAMAAIRETFEETGLALGRPDPRAAQLARGAPASWRAFYELGLVPAVDSLRFIFRAVTPPSRPKRFDARFFLADAAALHSDPDALEGCGELSHLRWLTLAEARRLELPLITEVVLAEVEEILAEDPDKDRPAPFFHHDEDRSWFDAL